MSVHMLLAEAMNLSPEDRQNLVDNLADSLAGEENANPTELTPEFIAELDEIDRDIKDHPELLVSLEKANARLAAESVK